MCNMKAIGARILLHVFVYSLLFVCCQGGEDSSSPIFQANIQTVLDSVKFSEVVESYKYIPLENPPQNKIGDVKQLIVCNDLIYVVSDGVYCFDVNGHYKFSINKKGHAGSEYVQINSVNVFNDKVYLYDNSQWKVLVYDANNGNFLQKIKLPYSVVSVFGTENEFLIDRSSLPCTQVTNDERFFVCKQSSLQKTLKCFLAEPEIKACIEGLISQHSDGYFCTNYWRCMAWKITPQDVSCYFKINIPQKYALTEDDISYLHSNGKISTQELRESNKIWGLTSIQECDNFITGKIGQGNHPLYYFFDKVTGKSQFFLSFSGMESWQLLPANIQCGNKDYFYCIYTADDICLIRSILGVTGQPKTEIANESKAHQIFSSISEEDGPVVVQYKIRAIE